MPIPNDPKRPPTHLVRTIRALVPFPTVQQRRPMRHATMQRDNLAKRQLRDRPRITKRRVKHRNPHRSRDIKINLIRPRTKTTHRKQPLALLEHIPSQLRLGPNPNHMRAPDRRDQRIALKRTMKRRDMKPLLLDQMRPRRMRPLQQHHLDLVLRKRSLNPITHGSTSPITSSPTTPSSRLESALCKVTTPIAIAPPNTAVSTSR